MFSSVRNLILLVVASINDVPINGERGERDNVGGQRFVEKHVVYEIALIWEIHSIILPFSGW